MKVLHTFGICVDVCLQAVKGKERGGAVSLQLGGSWASHMVLLSLPGSIFIQFKTYIN